jgi:hypothetical protein
MPDLIGSISNSKALSLRSARVGSDLKVLDANHTMLKTDAELANIDCHHDSLGPLSLKYQDRFVAYGSERGGRFFLSLDTASLFLIPIHLSHSPIPAGPAFLEIFIPFRSLPHLYHWHR